MERRGDDMQQLLYTVADALGPHLSGSSVLRSIVEAALDGAEADVRLGSAVERMLADARIHVIEDAPAKRRHEPDSAATPSTETSGRMEGDPLAAARRVLETDRGRSMKRRTKVILSAEDEVGLAMLYRVDCRMLEPGEIATLHGEAREAAEAMFLHNIRLAHSVARRYEGQGLEYDDLVQHAMRGLLRAVERFDPSAGFKFSTYATWWLRQAVTRALADESRLVRLPVHMYDLVRKVMSTRTRLTEDGRPPSVAALAGECDITPDKVLECLRLSISTVSLEIPMGHDGLTLGDLVDKHVDEPEHIEVNGLFPDDIDRLLALIKGREEDVLRRRFALAPYDEVSTLDEIGKVYGVTRERIRQIEKKALDNVRRLLALEGHELDVATTKRRRAPDSGADGREGFVRADIPA